MRQEWPGKAGLARTSARRQGYIDMFNTTNIQEDLDAALALVLSGQYRCLVLPSAGLGTGVAALPLEAPRTHAFLEAAVLRLRASLGAL